MSEMVERVAAALREIDFDLPGAGGLRGKLRIAPGQSKALARAAIAAMREPTSAMLLAGHGANLCENAPEVWAAMIDEALA